jgi:hypothetical protein
MRKLLQIVAVFCGILVTQAGYSQNDAMKQGAGNQPNMMRQDAAAQQRGASQQYQGDRNQQYRGDRSQGSYGQGNGGGGVIYDGECPEEHPCGETATGECWCMYCCYEPCYYTTRRCVTEEIPCKKCCCRYVDKYFEVQKCRMVPEYYCETCCKQEPEYYEVDDCKTCEKWVCDQHCKYVPRYYWKHVCGQEGCPSPCPQ